MYLIVCVIFGWIQDTGTLTTSFEMKILNNLARDCVCLSYLFKHVRIYITRHPLSSASLE